jgi:hypothetical protein
VEDIKGDVYPSVSAADGAVLQANFGAMPFKYPPPVGFSEVFRSQPLLSQRASLAFYLFFRFRFAFRIMTVAI